MSEKFRVGLDVVGFENNGSKLPISRVTLFIDDETVYTAGDDTGSELTARCDFATQEMAEAILNKVRGFVYTAYSAEAANLDPAAELGDGVTVGGVYSFISRIEDDGNGYPNIEAPGEKLIDEEFPFESPTTAEMKRKLAETRAQFKILHDEISSEIKALEDDVDGKYTKLTQTVDSFTFEDEDGTVIVDGGMVDASKIKTQDLNLSGAISFGDFDQSTQDIINEASNDAENAANKVQAWSYGGTTYIDGSKLYTGTVRASTLEGGYVGLLSSGGYTVGTLTMTGASSSSYAISLASGGALSLSAGYGAAYITGGGAAATFNNGNAYITSSGSGYVLVSGDTVTLGTTAKLSSGATITSDRNKKHSIEYMDAPENAETAAKYDAFFDGLRFARFKYDDGTSNRYHTALIANDVEESIIESGLTTQDVAAFCRMKEYAVDEKGMPTDEVIGETCALRYDEFVGMLIHRAQRNTKEIAELKAENEEIKSRLLKLEEKLTKMGV